MRARGRVKLEDLALLDGAVGHHLQVEHSNLFFAFADRQFTLAQHRLLHVCRGAWRGRASERASSVGEPNEGEWK